jgi:integrase
MPRTSDIWWRESKQCYYTTIDGRQVRLAKTMTQSRTRLQRILRGEHAPTVGAGTTFAQLADRFLEFSQHVNGRETYEVHRLYLQSFTDHVGHRLVARLCEADLDEWCQKHSVACGRVRAGGRRGGDRGAAAWSDNTQARARAIVLACLNYGVKKLNMPPHPLTHVRPGSVGSRERYLTPEERCTIRGAVKGTFAEYVFALEQTGARPFSELAKVTAADVDLEKGTMTMVRWKNSKKQKGKKRTIYLVEPILDLMRKLVARHPEGPLFRNQIGSPWTRQALTARFRKLAQVLGLPGLTAYAFRTAYITDALSRGVPVAVVAELCGTSIQTINKHYAKIDKKEDVLRDAARMAVGG